MNDETKPLVLVVDDDVFMLEFILEALNNHCRVITAENGATALQIAREQHPTLILADIKMPEMDGYELCRQIKDDFDIDQTPVLFLSALDSYENRLMGFEVGGEDFILKPINPKLLEAKVSLVLRKIEERQQLKSQLQYATNTAMLTMTTMSETGLLLEAFKQFNQCKFPLELVQTLVSALGSFGVDSVARLQRPTGEYIAVNARGPATELEISVIQHMSQMDRITQFKTRMAINYPHVNCLINNMPVEDPDRCGRLRDHLAMLLEAAEVRLEAINTSIQAQERGAVIAATIKSLSTAMANIDDLQRNGRATAAIVLGNVMSRIEATLVGLGLSERQEEALIAITQDGIETISTTLLAEAHFQDQLSQAIRELQKTINEE